MKTNVHPRSVNDDLLITIPRPHVRGQQREGGAPAAPSQFTERLKVALRRGLCRISPQTCAVQTFRAILQVNERDKRRFTQEPALLPHQRRQALVKNAEVEGVKKCSMWSCSPSHSRVCTKLNGRQMSAEVTALGSKSPQG